MTIRTRIQTRVFNFGRDINGNRTAHFVILDGDTSRQLHATKRRRQVGYGCEDLQAVTRFLETFEGGEWKRVSVLQQPSGEVLATYGRDLEGDYKTACIASAVAAQTYMEAAASKAAALERSNEASAEVRRLGMALNEAEACAERTGV